MVCDRLRLPPVLGDWVAITVVTIISVVIIITVISIIPAIIIISQNAVLGSLPNPALSAGIPQG